MDMSTNVRRGKWYSPWCSYLAAMLEERRLNPSDFALLVDDTQTNIWQYLRGIIRPPLAKVEAWSRKLRLDDDERIKFIRLAKLGHAHPDIIAELDELRRSRDKLVDGFRSFLLSQGHDPRKHGL